MNWIDVQNSPEILLYLKASSARYARAKRVFQLQLLLLVIIPTTLSVLKLLYPVLAVYVATTGVIFSLFDIFVTDRILKGLLRDGALCQEVFDCEVLRLPWVDRVAGKRPHVSRFSEWARSYRATTALEDWYPEAAGRIPIEFGRIICQISNCRWDARLRRLYAHVLVVVPVVIALGFLMYSLYSNPRVAALILTVSTLTPVVLWSLRIWRAQTELADSTLAQQEDLTELWRKSLVGEIEPDSLDSESRSIQSDIFKRRRASQPVFDWMYRWRRRQQEPEMVITAQELVDEFNRNRAGTL